MPATPALGFLEAAGIQHRVHPYPFDRLDRNSADTYGEAVADLLGVASTRVFKTLIAKVDQRPLMVIVPVSARLSLRAMAALASGKRALMADPDEAQRLTGYVVGGISPFGQKRKLPAFIDASALDFSTIFVSAGQRGLQVEVETAALIDHLGARVGHLT
ncbi:MAG TPA: Cys-tRNA(Pro) deacylase [Acidimicrobiia bacterium]|nr:Cys-tRNA(Pro) deacylase [Acidimicrobiia bacterium]